MMTEVVLTEASLVNKLVAICGRAGCDAKALRVGHDWQEHRDNVCSQRPVTCPDCSMPLLASTVDDHQKNTCRRRTARCPWCSDVVVLLEHVCPLEPCQCNKCHTSVSRRFLEKHQENVCLERQVSCPLRCGAEMAKKDEEKHLHDNLMAHMLAMMRRIDELESELEKKNGKVVNDHLSDIHVYDHDTGEYVVTKLEPEGSIPARYQVSPTIVNKANDSTIQGAEYVDVTEAIRRSQADGKAETRHALSTHIVHNGPSVQNRLVDSDLNKVVDAFFQYV